MTEFEHRMAAFRARFLDRAASDAGKIAAALARGDREELRSVCHGLSGNAGMFGFAELGNQAQAVEEAIDGGADADAVRVLTEDLLGQLAQVAQER